MVEFVEFGLVGRASVMQRVRLIETSMPWDDVDGDEKKSW